MKEKPTESSQRPTASAPPVTQNKGGWIPVSNPPEILELVLVAFRSTLVRQAYLSGRGEWIGKHIFKGDEATHWQPIPEAPRSSDEGTEERSA
jgi:hypothetical protein